MRKQAALPFDALLNVGLGGLARCHSDQRCTRHVDEGYDARSYARDGHRHLHRSCLHRNTGFARRVNFFQPIDISYSPPNYIRGARVFLILRKYNRSALMRQCANTVLPRVQIVGEPPGTRADRRSSFNTKAD